MDSYKFPEISLEITPDTIVWDAASFNRKNGTVTLVITLTAGATTHSQHFTIVKEALDRTDEAIDTLMLLMLLPFKLPE